MTRRALALIAVIGLAAVVAFVLVPSDAPLAETPANDTTTFKNVKVLTHVTSKSEMRQIMKAQSAALGVKCSHCHAAPPNFDSDEKKEKQVAREMMKMVQNLNETVFKDSKDKPAITCWTCHRGNTEPEHVVPQSAFDAIDAQK